MPKPPQTPLPDTLPNNSDTPILPGQALSDWIEAYFQYEVTTRESSKIIQRNDLRIFRSFLISETGSDDHARWVPRLSQRFKDILQQEVREDNRRRWNDRTVNRILAHVRTFSKWVHFYRPFLLGQPMARIKNIRTPHLLNVERAITPKERNQLLNQADLLTEFGGRSRDRHRYPDVENRPAARATAPGATGLSSIA